jgi:methyl-accepting chemotaxis protein
MTEIPSWWFYVSGLCFLLNILLFVALIIAVIKIIPMVQQTTQKVQELTEKVEGVANRVEEVAKNVGDKAGEIGHRATGILGSVENMAHSASRQFEKFSPFIVGALTAFRLVKALNEMKHGKSAAQATKEKTLEKQPAQQQKKKLLGIF